MSRIAVRVENLGKRYRIGSAAVRHDSVREALAHAARAPFRNLANLRRLGTFGAADSPDVVWALRDVSFEIPQGEVVGIIGRNGAGKSTLLKILSRITDPSTGFAEIHGRVGSLLEVGTGFHPELTGRENVYLNGSILGMDRAFIDRQFDEIVEFSGVERYVDTPVKRYSSGMYLRLAFAVAAHLEPEVLIVDEVLAVGDAEFQKKCMGKMGEVAKGGRTVLFVSHNMGAVRSLCQRVMLLRGGRKVAYGDPADIIGEYLAVHTEDHTGSRVWDDLSSAPGDEEIRVRSLAVRNAAGDAVVEVSDADDVFVEIEFQVLQPMRNPHVGFQLLTPDGTIVLESNNGDEVSDVGILPPGTHRSVCRIPGMFLNCGTYFVKLFGHVPNVRMLFPQEVLLPFSVLQTVNIGGGLGRRSGVVRPLLEWNNSFVDQLVGAGGR
ncbi:MAG TPA: ABC transporter ATP-binding protein [Longimicrobiaceae bacterium]|nr:ABC transporter ATP-binding protein [Longimicrobiaceae bacterium]